jgi:hypothetical protein
MTSCDLERLEAWVDGILDADTAAEVEAHVRDCAACGEELTWLRGEAAWMERRRAAQPPVRDEVWQSVAQRVGTDRRRARHRRTAAMMALAVAAAAAVVLMVRHPGLPVAEQRAVVAAPPGKPSPDAVVTRAEHEYDEAVAVLEAEYRRQRPELPPAIAARYDDALARTRAVMTEARTAAGHDLDARVALLDGYADYMWSLQTIVADLQVNR